MRAAEAQDWVRRLIRGSGRYPTKLDRLSVADVPEVGDVELSLHQPLTTFCGPNGVGKSILLKSIDAALNVDSAVFSQNSGIPNGVLEVSGMHDGTGFLVQRSQQRHNITGSIPQTTFMDSGNFTAKLSDVWSDIKDVAEILNEVEPLTLEDEDLDDVRYLACRNYRYVRVYEVDVGFAAPYFEVGYGAAQYDSRSMGLGELNALASWWNLRRSNPGSVLLIEEPEAFLSALSQEHLSHVVAKYLIKRRLTAVISTHSGAFMRITSNSGLVFLTRDAAGNVRANARPHSSMLRSVGIQHRLTAIVYVEDLAAKCLAKAVVRKFDPELILAIEFHAMGGDGEVASALRPNMNLKSQIRFFAAFDGDLRGNIPEDLSEVSLMLPGDVPFEVALRHLVEREYDAVCSALDHEEVHQILASLEGLDHHDWLTSLAAELERDLPSVIESLFPIWIAAPEVEAAAEEFCRSLRGLLNG